MPVKKINGKELHLKTFEVNTSAKNVRLALLNERDLAKLQSTLDSADTDNADDVVKVMDGQLDMIDGQIKFLKTILHLSDAQIEKIWDASLPDIINFSSQVSNAILGYDADKSEDSES